ncbi:MAG: Rne/Rng family ribonuclease [Bacteroidota bacterium]
MNNDLIIDVSASGVSIALLEDKQLVEISKEKSDVKYAVGDIYLGKVRRLMPGLNAAFVDVGYEKDAFLHYHDLGPQFRTLNKYLNLSLSKKGKVIPVNKFKCEKDIDKNGKINDVLKSGQYVVVQIAKEPISTKGPRLSSEISIAGRNLVLIPFSDKVSVSQKIQSKDERNRLKTLIQSIKPKNYGVIVRTVAEDKKVATLDTELRSLVKKWETAFEKLKGAFPPKQIISELDRTFTFIRDLLNVQFNSIIINDDVIYNEIKEYISTIAPEKEKIVKLYNKSVPIFEHFGIEKQIKGLFGKTVSIKNGAYLVIEHTEALHAIDVNSGYRSKSSKDQETNALEVNLAAAMAISQQLRLRDMGGIIIIDFIDMHQNEHKQMLFDKMKEEMAKDRTKHSILPLSRFGLMQITRQRVRPEMNINTLEKCPCCNGTGEISASILFDEELENTFHAIVTGLGSKKLFLHVHPFVAAYLKKGLFRSIRKTWQRKYKCKIIIVGVSSHQFLEYHFFDKNGKEIDPVKDIK